MAVSGQVVVNPDHLVGGDGSVKMALQLWSSRNGPVKYNTWQSVYFWLCRQDEFEDIPEVPDESATAKQARIRAMYLAIQEEVHGPDHQAQALIRGHVYKHQQSSALVAVGQSSDRDAGGALPNQGARLAVMPGRDEAGNLVTSAVMQVAVGQGLGRDATEALPDEYEDVSDKWFQYDIGTPRGQVTSYRPSMNSPDFLLHQSEAQAVWDNEQQTHTEFTDEQDERMERLALQLGEMEGSNEPGVEFVLRVEQLVCDYKAMYGQWLVADTERLNLRPSIKLFACERLAEIKADTFEHEDDFKQHVYALGKLGGRSVAQSRVFSKRVWESSIQYSPVPGRERKGVDGSGEATPFRGRPTLVPPSGWSSVATPASPQPARREWASPTSAELVNVMETVTDGFTQSLQKITDKFAEQTANSSNPHNGDSPKKDTYHSIASLDFKVPTPTIRDDDADLDRYDADFENCMACYSFGNRQVREVDKLYAYALGFREGSTRRRVFDNYIRQVTRKKRLPAEAAAVLTEVQKELRTYIYETRMQKLTRLDKEFEELHQGGLSHADFRTLWDSKLQDMEVSGMDMPTDETLYRKYLTKLNGELRARVLSKEWKIDGPDSVPRPATTHKDVAVAVGLGLEERADIYATSAAAGDSLYGIDSGGFAPKLASGNQRPAQSGSGITCYYCQGPHYTVGCPQKAADARGDDKQCLKNFQDRGTKCQAPGCGMPGHEQRHHLMGIQDHSKSGGGQGGGKDGGKGGGKNDGKGKGGGKGSKGKGKDDAVLPNPGDTQCRLGPTCHFLSSYGVCRHWHPQAEKKILLDKYKEKVARQGGAPPGGKNSGAKGKGKDDKGKGKSKGKDDKGKGKKGKDPPLGPKSPEINVTNETPVQKPKAKAAPKLSAGADGSWYMIHEEIRSMSDQFGHHGSRVERVANTMELGDFFELGIGEFAEHELCYNLGSANKLDMSLLKKSESSLVAMVDKFHALNPSFASIKRLSELEASAGELDQNFLVRLHQRPVGYSATTRLHMGRLCVPILNDSGATCSCLTEEQVVLLVNHTMRMLESGKMKMTDYNYPIVQMYKYKNPAILRGAEKNQLWRWNTRFP